MKMSRVRHAAATGLVAGLALAGFSFSPASGSTFTVANTSDSGPGSLRQAILDSSAGGSDTIVIPAGLGTINLLSTLNFTGADLTTVEGNGNTISYPAGTAFNSGTTVPYRLEDLIINANQGANTYNGSLSIVDSTLNVSSQGANTMDGALMLIDSTIDTTGGGLNTMDGDITVAGSEINADGGNAVNSSGGVVTVADSMITGSENLINTYGNVTITGSELVETLDGNAVNTSDGTVVIESSSLIGPSSDEYFNMGIYSTGADVSILNSTITGWAIGVSGGNVDIAYSTLVGNGYNGGDSLRNSIEAGVLTSFASVYETDFTNCVAQTVISQGYNWSSDDSCGFSATGDTENGTSPGLGALADNGGNSRTFLPQDGSPLLNAVPLASCQNGLGAGVTDDQRALTRPGDNGCEIGSVEIQPAIVPPTTEEPPPTSAAPPSTTDAPPPPNGPNPIPRNPNYAG